MFRWLPGDSIVSALSRVPHVVDMSISSTRGSEALILRAANPPDIMFATFRELDEAYKLKLNELSRPVPAGVPGNEEKQANLCTVVQAIHKLLIDRGGGSGLPVESVPQEFMHLFRTPLDVFDMFQEATLLRFLQKFPGVFQVFYDGNTWRVMTHSESVDIERSVMNMLMQPRLPRAVVRLAGIIPLPQKATNNVGSDQITSLVSILQSLQKKTDSSTLSGTAISKNLLPLVGKPSPQPLTQVTDPRASGASVTSQIQALLKKKKEAAGEPTSAKALSGLLEALKK